MDSHRLIFITVSGIYKLHDTICVIPIEQRRRGNGTHSSGSALHVSVGDTFGLSLEKELESQSQGWDRSLHIHLPEHETDFTHLKRENYFKTFTWLCQHAGSFFSVVACELLLFLGGSAVKKKNPPAMQETRKRRFDPWVGKIPWRRKWQSTPVFFPGKLHGQRNLADYSPWGQATDHGVAKVGCD